MTAIGAILFDLDNTLVDRDGAVAAWLERAIGVEAAAPLLALDGGGHSDRAAFFTAVSAATGWTPSIARSRFRAELPSLVTLRAGAADLLARLDPSLRLGIGTNGSVAMQTAKLAAVGLERRIEVVIISQAVGSRKPEPAFFDAALAALGSRADETLMVGDHPEHDIAGGRRAGMRTCWLRSPRFTAPAAADWTVDSLTELPVP